MDHAAEYLVQRLEPPALKKRPHLSPRVESEDRVRGVQLRICREKSRLKRPSGPAKIGYSSAEQPHD